MTLRRTFARLYARVAGYFWLPCPHCGDYFGGHEWARGEHLPSIPVGASATAAGMAVYAGTSLCPRCTCAGVGCRAHAARGLYLHHPGCEYVEGP